MTSRVRATLLAVALLIAFGVALVIQPTGYTKLSPGPSLNVLGKLEDKELVTINGAKTYQDDGQLRMLTVSEMGPERQLSLVSAVQAWLGDKTSVYPYDMLYPPGTTAQSDVDAGRLEMTSAQDAARAAALRAGGYKVPETSTVVVAAVSGDGPAKDRLKLGDVTVSIDSIAITSAEQVRELVRKHKPGESVRFVVLRGGKKVTVDVPTVALGKTGADAKTARIGVAPSLRSTYSFPVKITFNVPSDIMGPSAGMIFALSIYDKLTPGALTGDRVIAGTGTINDDGKVGPIGGIGQKIQAAQDANASLFLAPAGNCDEVKAADWNRNRMRIVKINTLTEAINAVKAWTANPDASLPECS